MSTNDRIRWGLLGTARINEKLIRGARASQTAEVTAVGSRSAEKGAAHAAWLEIDRVHDSYEALLADPDVDGIYISLPNAMHHEWTLKALAAGKHVLCEKPYTRHPEVIDVAWDAAEAAGLVLQEAFMWRFTPQADKMVELLPRVGEVVTIRASFSHRLGDDGDIRMSTRLEGGSLMDVGCYCISGCRVGAREPPEFVFGQQSTTADGVDRRFAAMLRFPSGPTATFHCGFDALDEKLEIIGSDGSIFLPEPWHSVRGVLYIDEEEVRVEPLNPYGCELDDMAAAIRGERAPRLGRADALAQARTIDALYRSAADAVPVSLT